MPQGDQNNILTLQILGRLLMNYGNNILLVIV